MDAATHKALDSRGVHTSTFDCDCVRCKCDLFLSAVVSPAKPGVCACLEHWQDVGEPADGCVILYRYVCVGYLVYACVRARCVYIIVHNNIRGQLGKFLYALWIIRPQIGKLQILHNMFIDIKFGACQFWGVCLVCCGVQAIF